jgi:hypothetical protein
MKMSRFSPELAALATGISGAADCRPQAEASTEAQAAAKSRERMFEKPL